MRTTEQAYTKTDEVVKLRNGMEMVLREGVKRGNLGDTDFLRRALRQIDSYEGYRVQTRLMKDITIDDVLYEVGTKVTSVVEGSHILFAIHRSEIWGTPITKLYVDPFDLLYDDELEDMFTAETKAMMMKSEWEFEYQDMVKKIKQGGLS